MNVAATVRSLDIVTTQAAVPVQAPVQPVKVLPVAAVAVRVTAVPETNVAEQPTPHDTPAGELLTRPDPVPLRLTESA